MSLLGKIVAILNVVAATLFLVVAFLDWGQRQSWSYAVSRYDLLVDGLPIDDKETDANGKVLVSKLTGSTLKDIFQQAGGKPVKTQAQEVKRVRDFVEAQVNDPAVPGTPAQKLARFLQPLARTYLDRERLAQAEKAVNAPADAEQQLRAELDQQFRGVDEVGADGHKHSLEERKANAARILFCLGEAQEEPAADLLASNTYKRFVVVCGVSQAARAVDEQALVLDKMTQDVIAAHDAERSQFVYDLNQSVYQSQNLADALAAHDHKFKETKAAADRQSAIVEERTAQIDDLVKQLDNLRKDTGAKLDKQAEAERVIMERLIDLRETSRKNQELERQIRQLEKLPAGR